MNPPPIDLKQYIREIPDFPKPGILFYDISSLLKHPDGWQLATARMTSVVCQWNPTLIAGIESRGFLTAAPLATRLGCGMLMLRKPGKLPGKTISHSYNLEYGSDSLHIQHDAITPNQRIVVVDDLLATGGTLQAAVTLLKKAGADVVGCAVMVELMALNGRKALETEVVSLLQYDD
ncbi:adenine phosphoribosyltransferase [Entomobacter blattae]|uniref:Adenine phosphoribosyltransferase n=1 Tax=Entomobacter blattae TaxID=2762277 RepID=A0A7H1NQM1_9PROT|nr:adenine phosphoribosyltransferase [Entomobacter blattae]QNT78081.1 Adenine phosphoribosyltransferase [Entomobacter blattae]